MLEAGLSQLLASDAAVGALIGTRIFPLVWPTDNPGWPCLTYQTISTVTEQVLAGTIGLTTCRVQTDAWSPTYAQAKELAAAVTACLQDFQGVLPDGTTVLNVTLDSSFDLFDSASGGTFRVSSDYLIQFQR